VFDGCLTVGGYPAPLWFWPNGFNPAVQSALDGWETTGQYTPVVFCESVTPITPSRAVMKMEKAYRPSHFGN